MTSHGIEMTPRDILRAAADLIEDRGWYRKGSPDGPGLVCASTAITNVAGFGSRAAVDARVLLLEYLASRAEVVYLASRAEVVQLLLGRVDSHTRIYAWNDSQPNAEVVVNAMRAAAQA